MKTLSLLLVFALVFVSVCFSQTPSIYIEGRYVGSGTQITASVNISGTGVMKGFEFRVKRIQYSLIPLGFELGSGFYSHGRWIYQSNLSDSELVVAAVGDPFEFSTGFELGKLKLFIPEELFGMVSVSFSMFDGKAGFIGQSTPFYIVSIPYNAYGNYNNDTLQNITDTEILWDLVGKILPAGENITITTDLNGDGIFSTWDVSLHLQKIVNPNFIWPIFSNTPAGVGIPTPTGPVNISWKKMEGGKWGLYSKEPITNGDLTAKSSLTSLSGNIGMFKKIDDKIYFINQSGSTSSPILIADAPVQLSGIVNEGRSVVVSATVTDVVENETATPALFVLSQNYPNPFNPSTTIGYQLPTAGIATLKVYDALGREVATLINEEKSAGNHSVEFNAATLPSGTYIYRISAGNFSQTKKMILSK